MDHRFRGERRGLIVLDTILERPSREEFKVLIDEYAAEAIRRFVPLTLRTQLQGWGRSYYSMEQHVAAIEAYNLPKLPEPADVAWNQTKQHVIQQFRRMPKVTQIHYQNFDDVTWLQSSAAGYGYVGHKGDDDNYSRAKRTAVTIAELLNHDRNYGPEAILQSTPDVAFTRTQLSQMKVKTKVQNVWGEAFHYVLLEGLFADPLIEAFKAEETFYFIGSHPLFSVPAFIEDIIRDKDYVYMFDWSGFDATVQEWEIRFAFQCLESRLTFPSTVEEQIWRFLTELFIYRKIAGPNGVLYLKNQGIPADDSLAAVNADQFVLMHSFADLASQFHWKLNSMKSEVSMHGEGGTFITRSVRESQSYRDELTCLRMLAYPEYPVESGAFSARRAKSIYCHSGIVSQFLCNIFMYLKDKYGSSTLPTEFRVWDLTDYEARKTRASELL